MKWDVSREEGKGMGQGNITGDFDFVCNILFCKKKRKGLQSLLKHNNIC